MARAEIIDMNDVNGAREDNLVDESIGKEVEASEPEQELEEELPEKYRGKSLRELVEMHQNTEKLMSKHSSEVGELRQIVDSFIRTQAQSTPQAPQEDDDVDFFTDPDRAVSKAIERHPVVRQAKEYTEEARKANSQAQLQRKHPDAMEVIGDPQFAEWVTSSRIRSALFQQADNYDFEAADELLTLWKERKAIANDALKAEKVARKATAKQAATGTARASAEKVPKKKYRRADIIRLMQDDPQRYQQLQPEIMAAYAEGRVV